jgi:carboxypeptidase C (cathepsin A)
MTDPNTAAPSAETIKRQQDAVNALLALPQYTAKAQIKLAKSTLDYNVSAGFVGVRSVKLGSEGSEPQAAVFTIAYTKVDKSLSQKTSSNANKRPVCFVFNGGPGSASIWLHLGALGPKRMVINDDSSAKPAPYVAQDNPLTWLEHFDLVFIDPPHTGWSICASDTVRKTMLSVDGDVTCLTEVIRAWLTRHQRWGAPLYLCGESYGTTRGAAMADSLQEAGMALTGLILVSCAMDLQTLVFSPANDLPYSLFLPGFANTAQFHGLLQGVLAKSSVAARSAAEDFANGDYLRALQMGSRLTPKEFTHTAKRISELIGLPTTLIEQHNLRITDEMYFFEAMRAQGTIVGRLDSRATAPMGANRTRRFEFDPAMDAIAAPYQIAAQAYFADSLGIKLEQPYFALNIDAHKAWRWNRGESTGNEFTSTTPDLARAMRRNANLKVLVASGRYDLGTPYSASDWSLAQLDIPPVVRQRLTHHYYDAGHMMYTRQADLVKLKRDLADWLGH